MALRLLGLYLYNVSIINLFISLLFNLKLGSEKLRDLAGARNGPWPWIPCLMGL